MGRAKSAVTDAVKKTNAGGIADGYGDGTVMAIYGVMAFIFSVKGAF